jgi:hypothetical protein
MAGSNIFISYSHKDEQTLERLLTFIKPLERNGLVDCWVDTRIEAGADWKQEIDTALDVAAIAVLVISQDFLASDFIFKEELPRILERESRGELEILPVFLRTSDVDKLKIPYSDRHGQPQHAILSRFQGFGTPDKPLMDLTFQNREKQYKKLIDRLRKLADEKAPKPTVSRPPTVSPRAGHKPIRAAPTQTVPMREYRLTIHIERHAEELRVSHYLPGTDAIASRTLPRDDVIRLSTKTLTASAGVSYGNQLFDLLFGQEVEWEGILRQLFHEPAPGYHPTPIRHPVHCRICTTEPQLSSLSWRQTSWNEYRLSDYGWTFSTTQTLHPVEDINTTAPCNVLIVISQGNNPQITPDQQHPQAIADVLQKVYIVRTSDKIQSPLIQRSRSEWRR